MNRVRKLPEEAGRFLTALIKYRASPISTAKRYWNLYRHRRFSPDEINFFRLLDPEITAQELQDIISKEELHTLQRRINPIDHAPQTEDKLRFYRHCIQCGLPTPRIFALSGPADDNFEDIVRINTTNDLLAFLNSTRADSLIIKPLDGCHGDGVSHLRRDHKAWRMDGRLIDASSLHTKLESFEYAHWIFQEFIHGHPDLLSLSGTESLQTVRVVTLINKDDTVSVLAARLRLINGNSPRDNFDYGRTGNLIANLDIETGKIRTVVGAHRIRGTLRYVERHPSTGRPLPGYIIPQWERILELATRSAQAFRPLVTVGWDIAICPDTPCLIEGNVYWDTLSGEPRMKEIYDSLSTRKPSLQSSG